MKKVILFGFLALGLLWGCQNPAQQDKTAKKEYKPIEIHPDTVINIVLDDSLREYFLKRGRELAAITQTRLKQELKKAIKEGGLVNAISFCNKRAMEITDSVSLAEKVYIRRLAKKYRNPANDMNKDESNIYKGFVINQIQRKWYPAVVSWDKKGRPVYYNTIVVDALCLKCHGTPGKEIPPEVAEKIAELYPDDKAVNFRAGDPRGMWAITFPGYMVTAAK